MTEGHMNHRFSATRNRRASPLYLLICLPESPRTGQNKRPRSRLLSVCLTGPRRRRVPVFKGKGAVDVLVILCPPPLRDAVLACACPVSWLTGLCDLHSLSPLSPVLIQWEAWQGMGDGKRDGRVFLPILSCSPCPGPSPVPPASWLCGSICSLVPAGLAGARGCGGI